LGGGPNAGVASGKFDGEKNRIRVWRGRKERGGAEEEVPGENTKKPELERGLYFRSGRRLMSQNA